MTIEIKLHLNDLPANINYGSSVAIHTETMGLEIKRDRLCLVQLCTESGEVHLVQFEKNKKYDAPNLKKLLENEKIEKIFHFARFDVAVLYWSLKVWTKNIYCTKLVSRLVRTYANEHGLKALCKELLGINLSKENQASYWGADSLTKSQMEYAASDVIYLHRLREALHKMLTKEKRETMAHSAFDALYLFCELDLGGWKGAFFDHH